MRPTGTPQLKVMFLGERKIAWRALSLMRQPVWAQVFDLRVVVTTPDLFLRLQPLTGEANPVFMNNCDRNKEALLELIKSESIDLIFSVQHRWVLSGEMIAAVGGLAFNLHNARLPDYKGYQSISHAIIRGEASYDSTVHWMAEEVDCGDVAYCETTTIEPQDTAVSLYGKTVKAALRVFERTLKALADGEHIPRLPLMGKGRFFGRHELEPYFDVTNVADPVELDRRIRGLFFPPYNTAQIRTLSGIVALVPQETLPGLTLGWSGTNQLDN